MDYQRGDHVRAVGFEGIALYFRRWLDEDFVICVMVGDDQEQVIEASLISHLPREEFCGECGQIGCHHDGLDRSETEEVLSDILVSETADRREGG